MSLTLTCKLRVPNRFLKSKIKTVPDKYTKSSIIKSILLSLNLRKLVYRLKMDSHIILFTLPNLNIVDLCLDFGSLTGI